MVNGLVFYDGPSMIDSAPILGIATNVTRKSENAKTGNMVQTWIVRKDVSPITAICEELDRSICGDCPHRGPMGERTCYVNVCQAPQSVWSGVQADKAHEKYIWRGDLGYRDAQTKLTDRPIRLGSYGDPAAIPFDTWDDLLDGDWSRVTGYTHQWRSHPEFRGYLQASCDSLEDARIAITEGWRVFLVVPIGESITWGTLPGMPGPKVVQCRANAGKQCIDCGLCDGKTCHVWIRAHGKFGDRIKW